MSITKGKWEVDWTSDKQDYVILCNDVVIATVNPLCADLPKTEEEANARLIAAAPETKRQRDALLAACKLASRRRHDGSCPTVAPIPVDPKNRRLSCNCWLKTMQEVIAKAEKE